MMKKKQKTKVSAIILTGGDGTRMPNSKVPKQFIEVAGKPLFIHCLETYEAMNEIDEICLVINKKFLRLYNKIFKRFSFRKLKRIVCGGRLRHDSIKNALVKIRHKGFVVIQNGVNPTTPSSLIRRCISVAKRTGAVTAFKPARHTVFIKNKNRLENVLNRSDLGYACDPQVYSVSIIKKAFLCAYKEKNLRDIPTLKLLRGTNPPVALVKSCANNIKVTGDVDLITITHILKSEGNKL